MMEVSFSDLPEEVLELVLSCLPDPVSQRRVSQVCSKWCAAIYRLRWLRLISFERRQHLRLPLAGSLHEVTGQKGFSLLLTVDCPVLMAGTAVFLPYRENLSHDLVGEVQLVRHGTPHCGPVGDRVAKTEFQISRADGLRWQEDCQGRTKYHCLQGPWRANRGAALGVECKGLHPLPVIFPGLVELEPGTRYLLSVSMREVKQGVPVSDQVGTVWGFQGVPRRKNGPDQNHFRWFQVYRTGLCSSVTSGQFPLIYYIT